MRGFEGLLERERESVVFIEDGVPMTASALEAAAGRLADQLKQTAVGRFAVFSPKPTVLAASLLAASAAERELVILPAPRATQDPWWEELRVGAVVDADGSQIQRTAAESPEEPGGAAVFIPTSGTSGTPKLSRHRLESLLGRIRLSRTHSGTARWLLTYLPHGFAGIQVILTALSTDSTAICLSRIDVAGLAEAAVSGSVTHISGTPTFWRSFLLCLGESASRLKLQQITLGGEVVDQATLDRLREVFPGAGLSHIYASTETGALFSVKDGLAGFPACWLKDPVDGVTLRIRDGVLEVRSPRATLGYLNRQEVPYTADGWLITGDRVEQRGDRVYFLGRQDTVINIGGAKVTPEEVESALLEAPGVLDLRAFPVPNPITGFVVGLEVVASPGADTEEVRREILRIARERLAGYKAPRLIRFVAAVECDATGKKTRKAG